MRGSRRRVVVTTSEATLLDEAEPSTEPRVTRSRHLPPFWMVVSGAFAATALALCWYQLATPGVLLGVYDGDDGVYFGAAVRLVDGVLPYRDFTVLHPPGIALLLSPIALLSHFTGTQVGLALARCLTAGVTAVNVVLVGLIVRHRGLFATAVGCGALALFPLAVAADNTLLLEPYLMFFCLLGVAVCFSGDRLASGRRLFLGGIALGFAGSVKIWAVFPVIALLLVLAVRSRRSLRRVALGVVVGFGVPTLPFLIAAPRAFVHDVLITQLSRSALAEAALPTTSRLAYITGFYGIKLMTLGTGAATVFSIAVGALILGCFARGRSSTLEWFLLLAVTLAIASLLVAPEFYNHYAYFPAALFAPLIALVLDRYRAAFARRLPGVTWPRYVDHLGILTVVALAVLILPGSFSFSHEYLEASAIEDPSAVIDFYVPVGTCFVSIDSVFALVADRFTPASPGCPALDDSFGTWIALDPSHPPPSAGPYPAALVAEWTHWLERANYLLYEPGDVKLPWTPELTRWFNTHYLLLATGYDYQLYVHEGA